MARPCIDAGAPVKRKVWSPQAAHHREHPGRQLRSRPEPVLGQELPAPQRPGRAAPHHGTQDGHHELGQGRVHVRFPAKPTTRTRTWSPAIAVGVWMGNSDSSSTALHQPRGLRHRLRGQALEVVHECLHRQRVGRMDGGCCRSRLQRPEGVVQARIDGFTGGQTGRWTRIATREWFIRGTEPGSRGAVDEPGLLYDKRCGGWLVDLTNVGEPSSWTRYIRGYMNRVGGSRGGVMAPTGGGCPARPTAKPRPSDEPQDRARPGPRRGRAPPTRGSTATATKPDEGD